MKMTLSHRYLAANLNVLEKLGFSKAVSYEVLELKQAVIETTAGRIDVARFLHLLNQAADQLENPQIALQMGYRFRIATFAQTGGVYGYCRNLKQVIDFNNRYQRLAIHVGDVVYEQDTNGRHYMRLVPFYSDVEHYRPITDLIMGAYVTAFRWLSWGSGEDIVGACLPYSRPSDMSYHDKIFQTKIAFNSDKTCLEFPEAAMSQDLPTHDPERLAKAKSKLEILLSADNATRSFNDAVEASIRGAIESGHVTSHIVADRMELSWSALRRNLKESGRGFRLRVDDVRQVMFLELYNSGESFSQIAQSLAYNDQPALNRAFHRWYGMSPTQWKTQQKQD